MLAYVYVLIAVAVRILGATVPFATYGFSPLPASILFFGAYKQRKQLLAPLLLFILTDVFLTTQLYKMAFNWDQTIIWAWYVGAFFLGSLLKDRVKPLYIGGAALGSAVSFFLVSNFAVWLGGKLYPMTWSGLTACYVAAIPFFRNGIASDLLFSAVLFGIPVLAAWLSAGAQERSPSNL